MALLPLLSIYDSNGDSYLLNVVWCNKWHPIFFAKLFLEMLCRISFTKINNVSNGNYFYLQNPLCMYKFLKDLQTCPKAFWNAYAYLCIYIKYAYAYFHVYAWKYELKLFKHNSTPDTFKEFFFFFITTLIKLHETCQMSMEALWN